ncbi:MAG: hypothetical protein C0423_07050 [Methylibium sp.]|nr:hypothetical protein [Methylibium sp.]
MLEPRIVPSCLQLQQLARELRQAELASDWPRLGLADAELARHAAHWLPAAQWSAAERAALQVLTQAHAQASRACEATLARVDQALIQMREGRGRWLAYAESNEWQDEGSAA